MPGATICCFKYRTYMNTVSVLDKLCMWLLQQQNVKRDTIEKKITAFAPASTLVATSAAAATAATATTTAAATAATAATAAAATDAINVNASG